MSRFEHDEDPFAGVPDVDERICDWVDGTMSARDRERFEGEMRVNPQLRQQVEEYETMVADIRDALQQPIEDVALADRVMATLATQATGGGPSTRSIWPFVWALTSAAALLGIAVLVDSWQAPPAATSPTAQVEGLEDLEVDGDVQLGREGQWQKGQVAGGDDKSPADKGLADKDLADKDLADGESANRDVVRRMMTVGEAAPKESEGKGDEQGGRDPGSSDPGSRDPGSRDPGSRDPGSRDRAAYGGLPKKLEEQQARPEAAPSEARREQPSEQARPQPNRAAAPTSAAPAESPLESEGTELRQRGLGKHAEAKPDGERAKTKKAKAAPDAAVTGDVPVRGGKPKDGQSPDGESSDGKSQDGRGAGRRGRSRRAGSPSGPSAPSPAGPAAPAGPGAKGPGSRGARSGAPNSSAPSGPSTGGPATGGPATGGPSTAGPAGPTGAAPRSRGFGGAVGNGGGSQTKSRGGRPDGRRKSAGEALETLGLVTFELVPLERARELREQAEVEAEAGEAHTDTPKADRPKASKPKAGNPKAGKPEAGNPKADEPRTEPQPRKKLKSADSDSFMLGSSRDDRAALRAWFDREAGLAQGLEELLERLEEEPEQKRAFGQITDQLSFGKVRFSRLATPAVPSGGGGGGTARKATASRDWIVEGPRDQVRTLLGALSRRAIEANGKVSRGEVLVRKHAAEQAADKRATTGLGGGAGGPIDTVPRPKAQQQQQSKPQHQPQPQQQPKPEPSGRSGNSDASEPSTVRIVLRFRARR